MKSRFGMPLIAIASLLGGMFAGCEKETAETVPAAQSGDTAMAPAGGGTDTAMAPAPGTDTAAAVKPESAQPASDGWITFKVASALYADDRVEGDYDVDTRNGVATLKGSVHSQAGKDAATQIARTVEGVTQVDNQLSVVTEERKEAVEEKDEAIKDRLDKMLDDDARFKEMDLNVDISAGKVTVKGEVPNSATAYQVLNAVSKVPGVRAVDSQMTLKTND